ncbi:MAG: endonuclease/exonuclease/phosphatase family protein [Duncaniella sp.]|nr:endonuclease/exonuclease/phosphatase family protein [Duncaniella sp.]MDE5919187.1 endonuclease/exonuclease/phosphatase family protein [Duncaniella sp.]MDE6170677.1 endonuclease/exonuclease/phosphatase family protein [Duncaniella sp.]MDE6328959.1 endonuclease/exonuclease/phosphatase family protein [Duncaniella sp.]MDE6465814.1 endonuclease/exonuclease/phosphatase family protein [Duncaniella sp.]
MEFAKHFNKFVFRPTRATIFAIVAALNTGVAMATVFSAYGGIFDPGKVVIAALMAMMFPGFIIASLIFLIADLVFWRKAAVVMALGLVASLPPIINFSPINLDHTELTEAQRQRSFTFLTYNVLHFWDFRGNVPGLSRNATIDYILATDADIVSLQEVEFLKSWPLWRITPEQIDELSSRYPYRMVNASYQLTLLSKYPFEFVDLHLPERIQRRFACFRIKIGNHTVHLFNVHLESIGLTPRDKELYQGLFDKAPGSEKALRRELTLVKTQLVSKLAKAFAERSEQAHAIRNAIDSIGGNFIVAGDFNDIPDCYAVRTIMGEDMTDAYAQNALGPTITYHGNKFYFRIDHVLYKGDFNCVDLERGSSPSSDHYPFLGTFVFDDNKP